LHLEFLAKKERHFPRALLGQDRASKERSTIRGAIGTVNEDPSAYPAGPKIRAGSFLPTHAGYTPCGAGDCGAAAPAKLKTNNGSKQRYCVEE